MPTLPRLFSFFVIFAEMSLKKRDNGFMEQYKKDY